MKIRIKGDQVNLLLDKVLKRLEDKYEMRDRRKSFKHARILAGNLMQDDPSIRRFLAQLENALRSGGPLIVEYSEIPQDFTPIIRRKQ